MFSPPTLTNKRTGEKVRYPSNTCSLNLLLVLANVLEGYNIQVAKGNEPSGQQK